MRDDPYDDASASRRCVSTRRAHSLLRDSRTTRSDRMNRTTAKESAPTNGTRLAGELAKIDALWRAANYLSVGQIYLLDNPLLRRHLTREDIKPRLLGHWGTTPGLNFIYAHLNRVIRKY